MIEPDIRWGEVRWGEVRRGETRLVYLDIYVFYRMFSPSSDNHKLRSRILDMAMGVFFAPIAGTTHVLIADAVSHARRTGTTSGRRPSRADMPRSAVRSTTMFHPHPSAPPMTCFRGTKGVPRKGVWASVSMRVWTCKELRAKHDQTSCYLRPPFLGTPLVPSRHTTLISLALSALIWHWRNE